MAIATSARKRHVTAPALSRTMLAAVLLWSAAAAADETIYYQDWVKVKNAQGVLQLPPLQRIVGRFDAHENSRLVVRYPGGDEGSAWAVELRNWLVSLGIRSADIQLQPGSGIPQAIVLRTEPSGLP